MNLEYGDAYEGPCKNCTDFSECCSRLGYCVNKYGLPEPPPIRSLWFGLRLFICFGYWPQCNANNHGWVCQRIAGHFGKHRDRNGKEFNV